MSPVSGFETMADDFMKEALTLGIKIAKTTDF